MSRATFAYEWNANESRDSFAYEYMNIMQKRDKATSKVRRPRSIAFEQWTPDSCFIQAVRHFDVRSDIKKCHFYMDFQCPMSEVVRRRPKGTDNSTAQWLRLVAIYFWMSCNIEFVDIL